MMKVNWILISVSLLVTFIISCTKNTENITQTTLVGNVKNEMQNKVVFPAFIFLGNELLATTDSIGNFSIVSLEADEYQITCSAVGYEDKTTLVVIIDNKITTANFFLVESDVKGRVYGEFQDGNLYQQRLIAKPEISNWNSKELFDGISGATLQEKTLGHEIGDRIVTLGDSLVAYSDGFGQYWFEIQCGTYPLSASCDGYFDRVQTIEVKPDEKIYVNFILSNE